MILMLTILVLSTIGAHPGTHPDGTISITAAGATHLTALLNSGALVPADLLCDIDGPLVAAVPDANPSLSGISGEIIVSGVPIRVPASVPIQVGENPDAFIPFGDLITAPPFIGHEMSVTGLLELIPEDATGTHLRCVADFVNLVVGHPPILGIVTENSVAGFYINGVHIIPHADPRIAGFVEIVDLAGAVIDIADIPEGALVSAGGDYDMATNTIHALLIVLESIQPPKLGEPDQINIFRAEGRLARPEIRVRGFTNNETSVITLYDFTNGVQGPQLATGIQAAPGAGGEWEFRGDIPLTAPTASGRPSHILAKTNNGGTATAQLNLK